jgi:hypothetical protein
VGSKGREWGVLSPTPGHVLTEFVRLDEAPSKLLLAFAATWDGERVHGNSVRCSAAQQIFSKESRSRSQIGTTYSTGDTLATTGAATRRSAARRRARKGAIAADGRRFSERQGQTVAANRR